MDLFQLTVGWTWKLLGISWSGIGPLFGVLFGITVALSFAIFRLGMNVALAALCSVGLAVSSMHLLNLPHLRDMPRRRSCWHWCSSLA